MKKKLFFWNWLIFHSFLTGRKCENWCILNANRWIDGSHIAKNMKPFFFWNCLLRNIKMSLFVGNTLTYKKRCLNKDIIWMACLDFGTLYTNFWTNCICCLKNCWLSFAFEFDMVLFAEKKSPVTFIHTISSVSGLILINDHYLVNV